MGREGFTPPRGEAPATRVATLARAGSARVGGSHNSEQLWEVLRGRGGAEGRPAGRGRPGAPRGATLTIQPRLPVRSHPQEGLQKGDKSGEVSGPAEARCKQLPPPRPVNKARPGAPSIPRIRASSRQGTGPGPAPPPHPRPPHPPLPGPRRRAPSCRSA